jgi:hypothetical protein
LLFLVRVRAPSLVSILLLAMLAVSSSVDAAPVSVRYPEATSRGFVVLRAPNGDVIAHGESQQITRKDRLENRLTFHFKDGSLWEETLTFTQQRVFRLMTYRQVQRGPSFPERSEVSFDRDTGRYRAQVNDDTAEGTLELPEDLHNGMTGMLLKNLPAGGSADGHVLAFTPKPRLLESRLRADGEDKFLVGPATYTATRWLVKLELKGRLTGLVASIAGKEPPDVRYWIASGTPPAFVKFEGPMFANGPSWRAELTAPRWSDAASR